MYWYLPWVWTTSFWDGLISGGSYVATAMRDEDIDVAAELHSEAFARPWSGDELSALLAQDGVFGVVARRVGQSGGSRPAGFVVARVAADEAEILTITVDRKARKQGIGRLLMDHVLQRLHSDRVPSLFLEVDEENVAALKLYKRLRFEEVGRRPAYYPASGGRKTSALILKRVLF